MADHHGTQGPSPRPSRPKDVKRWWGWRRPRGARSAPWERVKEADADRWGECYTMLMELSELRTGHGDYEYWLGGEGQAPGPF